MVADARATFGELLRGHRAAEGLTQQELAERAGLSARGILREQSGMSTPVRAALRITQ
jgi:transcriptional regulator with XRE-family HTH domain